MAMYRQGKTHSPIIMQSVKSTQVQKPVLQMAGAVAPGPASPSDLVGPGGPGVLPGVLPGGPGVLPGGGAYRGVATPVTVPPPPPSYAVTVNTQLKSQSCIFLQILRCLKKSHFSLLLVVLSCQ